MLTKYKYGLTVMRMNPLHIGHIRTINVMLEECEYIAIVIGSIQEMGTSRNPFNLTERKKMVKNVFKDQWERIQVIGVEDIFNDMKWAGYVLSKVPNSDVLEAYYCGSQYDGHWFEGLDLDIRIVDRADQGVPFVSGTMIRDMLLYGDSRWRNFIPQCNWGIIEKKFDVKEVVQSCDNCGCCIMDEKNQCASCGWENEEKK